MLSLLKNKFKEIAHGIATFSVQEKLFIICAMLCGFLICSEYAIIRPVSNSLFIHAYSSNFFPYVWLATIPVNLLLVSLYNYLLQKWGCIKLFFIVVSIVIAVNFTAALFFQKASFIPFAFYIWKEIYVLLMFQQLWSVIHSTIKIDQAKYLYGLFFGMGSLGAVSGSFLASNFATSLGSEKLLFFTLPIYFLMALIYRKMVKNSSANSIQAELSEQNTPSFLHGVRLIKNSNFLLLILSVVIFMQVISCIVDFQFNHYLEINYPNKDFRTEYAAKILSVVHVVTLFLQFIGSFVLIQLLGLKRVHMFVPLFLSLGIIGGLLFPFISFLAFSFVAVKSFDFSLFGVIKEMLYVPLSPEEKFRAKSLIDVFAYRTAKGLASIMILLLQFIAFSQVFYLLHWIAIVIFAIWIAIMAIMFKKIEIPAKELF
ncbi:MAG: hypothetical protein L0207_02520 [Chlamydiae bacterium]|nr:hypothetical protein [Chlamydiota bacterium]